MTDCYYEHWVQHVFSPVMSVGWFWKKKEEKKQEAEEKERRKQERERKRKEKEENKKTAEERIRKA